MLALKGYYNGKEFVPLDKADVKPNQKVIITVLDEYVYIKNNSVSDEIKLNLDAVRKLTGLLANEDSKVLNEFDETLSKRVNFRRENADI